MSAPIPFSSPWGYGNPRGGSAIDSPVTMMGESVGRSLELPLPQVFPIPTAQIYNAEGDVTTVAVESGVLIPLVPGNTTGGLDIPSNNIAVLNAVNIYITDMLAITNVRFTVFFNNSPLPGYTNLKIFPRVAPYVGNAFDTTAFPLVGPGTLTVRYTNIDGGSYQVGASLGGWYWSTNADVAYKSVGAGL